MDRLGSLEIARNVCFAAALGTSRRQNSARPPVVITLATFVMRASVSALD